MDNSSGKPQPKGTGKMFFEKTGGRQKTMERIRRKGLVRRKGEKVPIMSDQMEERCRKFAVTKEDTSHRAHGEKRHVLVGGFFQRG